MKKILLAPINALVWTTRNPAETMLICIPIFAMSSFFMNVGSPAMLGGLMAFFACISEKYIFQYDKPTKLYNILIIVILIIGVTALFIVGGKEFKSSWSATENCLSTFMGAFWGTMIAHFLISMIDREREESKKRKEENRLWQEKQKEQRIISQKEKEGFVAIKKEGKLIGYIEKNKYEDFINENVKNEN